MTVKINRKEPPNATILEGKLSPYPEKDFSIDEEEERWKNAMSRVKPKRKPARKKRLSASQKAKILDEHKRGFSIRKIAERNTTPKSTIADIVSKHQKMTK